MASIDFTDYGQASNAAFMGDFGNREHVLPGGGELDAAAAFLGEGAYTIQINDAAAAAGDTTIGVDALPVALPDNTELRFGGVVVTLNGAATAGATSLTVDALPGAVADNAQATYDTTADTRIVPAGFVVGRTFTEMAAGAAFGPAADTDDEVFIVLADVNLDRGTHADFVRPNSLIKEDFLPGFAGLSTAVKAKVRARYVCIQS